MSLPVDVLISEHKLILLVVDRIKKESDRISITKVVNPNFITTVVDFFRSYADRFHHGKEEAILFRELSEKNHNEVDRKVMNELMMEHAFARRTVTALDNAKEKYVLGDKEVLSEVLNLLSSLIQLYPSHIEKEDKCFFYPCMEYFSIQEKKEMLTSFLSFNQNFTDKRYKQIIDLL